jgi:hypothetical protein
MNLYHTPLKMRVFQKSVLNTQKSIGKDNSEKLVEPLIKQYVTPPDQQPNMMSGKQKAVSLHSIAFAINKEPQDPNQV